jgi:hypothetical protein
MKPTHSPDVADTIGLIRAGILILPLGAALKLIGNLGTFNSAGYGVPQPTEAATVTTPGFFLGGLTDSILPVLLSPFAVLALFAYLLPHGQRPHADRGPNLRLARRRCHPVRAGCHQLPDPRTRARLPSRPTPSDGHHRQVLHLVPRRHGLPGVLVAIGAILLPSSCGDPPRCPAPPQCCSPSPPC